MKHILNYTEFITEMRNDKKKNCPHLESGSSNSDSPSDNVNSSITSNPTDTLRASKNPPAKIVQNSIPILAKIKKFENNIIILPIFWTIFAAQSRWALQ